MAKIYIAIGHGWQINGGSFDTGCTWNGDTEAAMAKEVVGHILEVFNANGVEYMTDYPGNDYNITEGVARANAAGCSCYISIHLDYELAGPGIMPIIYPGSTDGARLAGCIRNSMKLRLPGLNDRGNLERADYEVNHTNMPACIMEIGSIKADNAFIKNNYTMFGHSIAYGILDFCGIAYHGIDKGGTTPAPAPQPQPAPSPAPTPQPSAYSWDTTDIQYFLNICNYGAPDIDGIMGPETRQCLKNAQAAYGIDVDGIWGPVTQAHAEAQILQYQERLVSLGHTVGNVDGIAGPATMQAVKNFQSVNGLDPDGIVGPLTFAKLFDPAAVPYVAPAAGSSPAPASSATELKNFGPDEFKCACGCGGDVKPELKLKVQALRDELSRRLGTDCPIVITSGYRCASQNARVGGVAGSLHMTGDAADLYAQGRMSRQMVDTISDCAHAVGLGTLRYHDRLFVHVQLPWTDYDME